MTHPPFDDLHQSNRRHFHSLWQRAKNKDLDGLTEEERRLAEIMLAHADEYFNQFEFADVTADHQVDPDREVDPFLHVSLHSVAENQVRERNPIEALQFYNAMLRQKCSRHEALHLLIAILVQLLFPVLKGEGPFPLDTYRRLLKRYKSRKPDKILDLLNDDPDLVSNDPPKTRTSQVTEEIKSIVENKSFQSIEEAQAFMDTFMGQKNREGIPDFLGLSPEQMHRLLHQPLANTSDMVTLHTAFSREDLEAVPIVAEADYFLKRLAESQPLKATAKGNLPRAFAQEFHARFSDFPELRFQVMSEQDERKLSALRHILVMCGWVKKKGPYFSLTRSGEKIVEKGLGPENFYHLLEVYLKRFNWAFGDRYPELGIIQQGALFSLYLLRVKGGDSIHSDRLGDFFIRAFPGALSLAEGHPYSTPEKMVRRAFTLRFIERFCGYFGLVTLREEKKEYAQVDLFVQASPFYDKVFQWKAEGFKRSEGNSNFTA